MTKKIIFSPANDYVAKHVQRPLPAKKYVPEWMKPQERVAFDNVEIDNQGNIQNRQVSRCMPFRDALTSGYIQESWTEILVRVKDGQLQWYTASKPDIMSNTHLPSGVSIGSDYYPAEFMMKMVWYPRMPKGYSVLLCPPLNRLDLPFTCTTGIIDADRFFHIDFANVPFYIKAGFEGVIPVGTPLYQMIPIKRESWKSEELKWDADKLESLVKEPGRRFFSFYRNNFWVKKSFN